MLYTKGDSCAVVAEGYCIARFVTLGCAIDVATQLTDYGFCRRTLVCTNRSNRKGTSRKQYLGGNSQNLWKQFHERDLPVFEMPLATAGTSRR
ncbi:MAG: hypothetical protein HOK04_07460 [Verrucomicrobia bacterium]|nr:hypothetical protein [Verrucomicrobiota bacterium]